MNCPRLFRITRLFLVVFVSLGVAAWAASQRANQTQRFVIDAIVSQQDGGDRARVMILEKAGVPYVSTKDGAGYVEEMVVASLNFASFSGTTVSTAWLAGAEHVFVGRVNFSRAPKGFPLAGYIFDSDHVYPLTFKLVKGQGYVRLCGRGTVLSPSRASTSVGGGENVGDWIRRLDSPTAWDREGAAQALGWLARTDQEKNIAVPALISALSDQLVEVRRDAAEALGRIRDRRAAEALASLTRAGSERDEWVRKVAAEALERIGK